jgi:hypothetical protein
MAFGSRIMMRRTIERVALKCSLMPMAIQLFPALWKMVNMFSQAGVNPRGVERCMIEPAVRRAEQQEFSKRN